ncbi:MAG: sulfite exporter TauE/SafE family protein [Pseudomonadota bacterium]
MTLIEILVQLLVAAAAFLQGVTGIGFALVAGPVLLMALNDASALQITALLNLLIALVLAPSVAGRADMTLLKRFGAAALIALPFGLALFALASPSILKLVAGVVVGGLTIAMIRGARGGTIKTDARGDWMAGGLAGALGGALSMLGPPISLRMAARRIEKSRNRATVLAFFVVGYPLVFVGQSLATEFSADPLWGTLIYAPATLIGAFAGQFAVKHVSELFFRRLVMVVLLATAVSLIIDAMRSVFAV